MMWKVSEGGGGELWEKHERRRHLILDILKAPEVYCSSIISSLKTTFTVCPFTTGVLNAASSQREKWA